MSQPFPDRGDNFQTVGRPAPLATFIAERQAVGDAALVVVGLRLAASQTTRPDLAPKYRELADRLDAIVRERCGR